jgi:anti-anti-sigma factor
VATDRALSPEQGQVRRALTLHLAGDLDISSLPTLNMQMSKAMSTPPPDLVIVDMSGVTFMDCTSLGPLVLARARLGPRLRLQGATVPVIRLLKVTKLYEELVGQSPY